MVRAGGEQPLVWRCQCLRPPRQTGAGPRFGGEVLRHPGAGVIQGVVVPIGNGLGLTGLTVIELTVIQRTRSHAGNWNRHTVLGFKDAEQPSATTLSCLRL